MRSEYDDMLKGSDPEDLDPKKSNFLGLKISAFFFVLTGSVLIAGSLTGGFEGLRQDDFSVKAPPVYDIPDDGQLAGAPAWPERSDEAQEGYEEKPVEEETESGTWQRSETLDFAGNRESDSETVENSAGGEWHDLETSAPSSESDQRSKEDKALAIINYILKGDKEALSKEAGRNISDSEITFLQRGLIETVREELGLELEPGRYLTEEEISVIESFSFEDPGQ